MKKKTCSLLIESHFVDSVNFTYEVFDIGKYSQSLLWITLQIHIVNAIVGILNEWFPLRLDLSYINWEHGQHYLRRSMYYFYDRHEHSDINIGSLDHFILKLQTVRANNDNEKLRFYYRTLLTNVLLIYLSYTLSG